PLTSNTFYLSNAEYIEKKRRISVEFSNLEQTKRISFPFIPCIMVPDSCRNLLLTPKESSGKGFRLEKISNGIKIFSPDFSFLESINLSIEKKGILLSPERQFLLSNNWSFFDSFELNGEINKKELEGIPEIKFDFNSDSIKENISELFSLSEKNAKSFLNKIALSNILCEKITFLPFSKNKIFDSFLEAVFFRNNFAFEKKKPKFDSGFTEKNNFSRLKKADFSFVWPVLFSFPFYNLGFDSVNCSCCKPSSLNEKNTLPSSLVEVKFTEDAIYFESSNIVWSEFFHSAASGKEKRIKRMNEWKLKEVPAGPFFRNDVLRIPFDDSLKLFREKKAVFLSDHDLIWFCRKKESFLSRELNELNKKILFFGAKLEELEKNSIKENGLAFSIYLTNDPEFSFFSEYRNSLKEIFSSVPFILSSHSTAFFDFSLSNSIKCISSSFLAKFRDFSLSNSTSSFISKDSVLIDSDNPLDLLLEFSKTEKIPVPELLIQ
ncbi:hypothetical protein KKB11_02190, partial [Candidatus Micrarchaeota archaeon]|nr:hypothetical protein [Candidatus Micrarchaeota archaeon]